MEWTVAFFGAKFDRKILNNRRKIVTNLCQFEKYLRYLDVCFVNVTAVELSSNKDIKINILSSTLSVLYIRRMLSHLFGSFR